MRAVALGLRVCGFHHLRPIVFSQVWGAAMFCWEPAAGLSRGSAGQPSFLVSADRSPLPLRLQDYYYAQQHQRKARLKRAVEQSAK